MKASKAAYEFSWLWENSQWADFTVDVLPAEAGSDTAPLYTLKLQSVVLAAASPGHFRGHCSRLKGEPPSSAPARKQRKSARVGAKRRASDTADQHTLDNVATDQAYAYRLTLSPGEPEGVPRAVLCHLYTGALPDDPEQLIWMLRRADYLDLASTVHAILQKLQSVSSEQLTLQHAELLHSLPDLQCDTWQGEAAEQPAAGPGAPAAAGQAAAAAAPEQAAAPATTAGQPVATTASAPAPAKTAAALLQELTDSLLLAHLPSAPAIVTDAALLAQFTQLPLALVKRWVKLDKYEVDSGNTLAVLFTAWHDAQPEPPSAEQCLQLTYMLPLAAVTVCFHAQALQRCKWWRHSSNALTEHMFAVLLKHDNSYQKHWQETKQGTSVLERATECKTHKWTLTAEQVKELWYEDMLYLPPFYYAGYQLGVELSLNPPETVEDGNEDSVSLGLRNTVIWPSQLASVNGLPDTPGDIFHVTVNVAGAGARVRYSDTFCMDGWGWDEVSESFVFKSHEALRAMLLAPGCCIEVGVSLRQDREQS